MGASDRLSLERFLVGNPELERLEKLLGQFNLFEALGTVRQELRHSDFLSFLLDPHQAHGLGDDFLTALLQRAVQTGGEEALPVSAVELHLWDLSDTAVQREWRNIDILLLNEDQQLAVVIENKVSSSEHSNQLVRYSDLVAQRFPDFKILGIYLTPDGQAPSDAGYAPLSYGVVREVVADMLERRGPALGEDVRAALRHYLQLLERHVVSESEIAELCRQIYRKHRRALDLIFEHRPDTTAAISEYLKSLIAESEAVIPDQSSKAYVRFSLPQWDIRPMMEGSWTRTGRILLFEFVMDYRGLFLHLQIGPGPTEIRQTLFDAAQKGKVLAPSSKTLHKDWNDIWPNRKIVRTEAMEELPLEELENKISDYWKHFLQNDLPAIAAEMRPAIDKVSKMAVG